MVICLRNHEDATADKEEKNNNGRGKDHLPSTQIFVNRVMLLKEFAVTETMFG